MKSTVVSSNMGFCGSRSADDDAVWIFAASHGQSIVTKDADFNQRAFLDHKNHRLMEVVQGKRADELRAAHSEPAELQGAARNGPGQVTILISTDEH
jgi:hypothetical protein